MIKEMINKRLIDYLQHNYHYLFITYIKNISFQHKYSIR